MRSNTHQRDENQRPTRLRHRLVLAVSVSLALLGGVFPATGAAQSLIGTGQTLDGEPTCAGLPVTINMQLGDSGLGTNGDDVILGTDGNDVIRGYIGNDIICGGGGDDSIYAGYGQDRVFGEAGADTIWGGYGVDELRGGDGNDRMYGGDGIDELYGDDGQDRLYGNGDGDRIEGGPGNDYLRGGSGDDTLDGVAGRNFIIGGSGSDTIDGGPENDRIFGSTGADFINGQGGNDFLRGNEGDDWLSGGDGDDLMYGSAGHDVMNGGVGDDGLYGGDGDDELAGFTGFDVCSGNDGFDTSLDCERNSFIEELTSTPPVGVGPDGCLQNSTVEQVDTTWLAGQFIGRIRPGHVGTGTAIDLRTTTVSVHDASQDQIVDGRALVDSRWGLVQLDSSIDLCVVGGEITSPNPYNVTWLENYDTDPRKLGYGYRLGTTRNHTAIDLGDAVRPVINGMYFFNLHDGPRFNDASDWRLEHSWGEYTRDDCVENDRMASGVIYDTLFDGCYTGYSNRPTDPTVSGIANSVTFDRVLLRMELMPGPYDTCNRLYLYYNSARAPYEAEPCVAREVYGTGPLFKLADQSDPTGSINPTFNLIDSVFVVEQAPQGDRRANFPPAAKIGQCSGVVVIYLGSGAYPGRLPPEGCYTLLTGVEGQAEWAARVADWHQRHPHVAPDRKDPATYGDVTFPRPAFNAAETAQTTPAG